MAYQRKPKPDPKHVVSFSGGKDSTAMLLMMIERGMHIDEILAFDSGWEFPQMYDHWKQVEEYTGREITVVKSHIEFVDWMITRDFTMKDGTKRKGYGWPSHSRRWCTTKKINALYKGRRNDIMYVGIASDEMQRVKAEPKKIYPLIEWGVTEEDALQYCKDRGFTWGGLYDHFSRVSCFCCPLKGLDDVRKIRKFYPDLWEKMLEWDRIIPERRGFRGYKTVEDLEERFAREEAEQIMIGE